MKFVEEGATCQLYKLDQAVQLPREAEIFFVSGVSRPPRAVGKISSFSLNQIENLFLQDSEVEESPEVQRVAGRVYGWELREQDGEFCGEVLENDKDTPARLMVQSICGPLHELSEIHLAFLLGGFDVLLKPPAELDGRRSLMRENMI